MVLALRTCTNICIYLFNQPTPTSQYCQLHCLSCFQVGTYKLTCKYYFHRFTINPNQYLHLGDIELNPCLCLNFFNIVKQLESFSEYWVSDTNVIVLSYTEEKGF